MLEIRATERVLGALRRTIHRTGVHVGRFPIRDSLQGHLKRLFVTQRINCVIDVGAHAGDYAEDIREIGYTGRIVSFEPVRATFDELSSKAARTSNWMVHNAALGSTDGELEINVCDGSVFNSFLSPSDFAVRRFGDSVAITRRERVNIHRLDSIFSDCIAGLDEPRVFLKMDTQGYDHEVFAGAAGVLSQLVGVQSELAVQTCYESMIDYLGALTTFHRAGFRPTGFFPVTCATDGLRTIEFDCVLLRADDGA